MEIMRANRAITEQVVEKVSTAEGVSQDSLAPLYDAVDPEALEALLASARTEDSTSVRVSFSYEGYAVTVTDEGQVTVDESTTV